MSPQTGRLRRTPRAAALRAALLLVLLPLSLSVTAARSEAMTLAVAWDPVKILFSIRGVVNHPIVLSDASSLVTALWTAQPTVDGNTDVPFAIYCSQWNGTQWSDPIDIIASTGQGARYPEGVVDRSGTLHLVWIGANATMYYSRVRNADACLARAWSRPAALSRGEALHADITTDPSGTLHVVYAEREGDVFYMRSENGGNTWIRQSRISDVDTGRISSDVPFASVDATGRIHVVWEEAQLPTGFPLTGVYYAQSSDQGNTWTPPLQVASGDYGDVNVLALGPRTVHLLWNGRAAISGRYDQWSGDGGSTWSPPGEIISRKALPGSGLTGQPWMAVDSAGIAHLVSGMNSGTEGQALHLEWDGHNWSPPENIAGAFKSPLEQTRIAISQGNELHVVFHGGNLIGYVHGRAPAPQQTPAPLPAPATAPTARATAADGNPTAPAALPTAGAPEASGAGSALEGAQGQNSAIAWGVVPVLFLLGFVVVTRWRARTR